MNRNLPYNGFSASHLNNSLRLRSKPMSTKSSRRTTMNLAGLVSVLVIAIYLTGSILPTASLAQEGTKDNVPRGRLSASITDGQYPASYFPNTELLGDAEMRITALGSGMPNLTRKSASICYFVELGNGDKFLFDIGSGAMANMFSLRPDFSKIDKVFASHLHTDHVGDFMGLHIGSWL